MDIKQIKTDSDKTTESLNTEEQQVVNEHFKLLVHNRFFRKISQLF